MNEREGCDVVCDVVVEVVDEDGNVYDVYPEFWAIMKIWKYEWNVIGPVDLFILFLICFVFEAGFSYKLYFSFKGYLVPNCL